MKNKYDIVCCICRILNGLHIRVHDFNNLSVTADKFSKIVKINIEKPKLNSSTQTHEKHQ